MYSLQPLFGNFCCFASTTAMVAIFFMDPSFSIARAEIVSTVSIADTFVSSQSPTAHYGAAGGLAVSGPLATRAGVIKGEFQSYLKFDMSSLASQFNGVFGNGLWSVNSVVLTVTSSTPNNALFNDSTNGANLSAFWMSNDSWTQGAGSPNAPTFPSASSTDIVWNMKSNFDSVLNDVFVGSSSIALADGSANPIAISLGQGVMSDILSGRSLALDCRWPTRANRRS